MTTEVIRQFYQDNLAQPVEQGLAKCRETYAWGVGKVTEYEDVVLTHVKNNIPEGAHKQTEKVVRAWHAVLATCLALTGNYVCALGATAYFGARVIYALRPLMVTLATKTWNKANFALACTEAKKNLKDLYEATRPALFVLAAAAAGVQTLFGLIRLAPTQLVMVPIYASIATAMYDEEPPAAAVPQAQPQLQQVAQPDANAVQAQVQNPQYQYVDANLNHH